MDPIAKMLEIAKTAPKGRPVVLSEDILEKLNLCVEGDWSFEDLIESQVDDSAIQELSTAASVGSGTELPLGKDEEEDEQLEKLVPQIEVYRRRQNLPEGKLLPKHVRHFCEGLGLPEGFSERAVKYFKGKGYVS